MKLAFLDLPDDRVDLISKARHDPNIEIVLVAHPDPEALALRIAEVLQIPHSTEPLDLLTLKPDRVALPSLASPSAAALVRAGISERIFVTLEDLANHWPSAETRAPAEEPNPIELWESQYDEAAGAARLNRIRAALALSEDRQFLFSEVLSLAVEQSNADSGSIMVVDEEARELRIAFADGLSADIVRTTRQRLGEGIAGKVARDGKPLITNDRSTTRATRKTVSGCAPSRRCPPRSRSRTHDRRAERIEQPRGNRVQGGRPREAGRDRGTDLGDPGPRDPRRAARPGRRRAPRPT